MADNSVSVPKIVVTEGKAAGKEFQLNKRVVFEIGRAASSNIEIPDTGVAMNHCRIYKEQGTFTLYDLNTTKGTFINGEKITKEVLSDGDTIQIGPVLMVFRSPEAPKAAPKEEAEEAAQPAPWEDVPIAEEPAGKRAATREEKETGLIADKPIVAIEEEAPTPTPAPPPPVGAASAKLTVLEGPIAGTVFDLEGKSEFSIGRASEADIKIMDIKISRHHTKIMKEGDQWWAIDRDSRNGTFVNGEQINRQSLRDGDHIKVGFSIMQFNLVGVAAAEPAASPEVDRRGRARRKATGGKKKKRAPTGTPEAKTKAHGRQGAREPTPAAGLTCDLCSRDLSPDDLSSGLAVSSQGKNYCLTCVRKLQNLASGGAGPHPALPSTGSPRDSLDDEDIDLLLKEEVPDEDEDFFS